MLSKMTRLCSFTMATGPVMKGTTFCRCRMADGYGVQSCKKPCLANRVGFALSSAAAATFQSNGSQSPPNSAEHWDVRQRGIAPVVEELFLNHSGLMHMNGAWPGQFGFTDVEHGNWLFWEFFNYCTLCPTGRPTWNCIDRMMDQRLGERFQQSFNGKFVEPKTGYTQTSLKTIPPRSLPEAKDHPTLRFGVSVDDSFTSKGVTVTDIESHSPASNRSRNGDIIEWINGKEVSDFVAYSDLVKSSPRRISFRFRRHGTEQSGETTLRW